MNDYVAHTQVLQASIIWEQCTEVPTKFSAGKTTVINGKVYCGGGYTDVRDNRYVVYCYDPSQDMWTPLPPLPVRWFGLGQVNGKLVVVGGMKRRDDLETNEIYIYGTSMRSQKWKQTISPMPTARHSPCVVSLQSALVVVGGVTSTNDHTNAVEIFKLDTSQWYHTTLLPTGYCAMTLVAIGNTCYALGGYRDHKGPSQFSVVLCASVDNLLCNAVPANHMHSCDTQSAWKTLLNTSTYGSTVAVLAGKLLTIGGRESSTKNAKKKEIYMYSHSTNSWIYISDLPAPLSSTAVAILSSTEILVIAGLDDSGKVNNVYKGTLQLEL